MKMYKVIIVLALIFSGIFLFLLFFSRSLEEVEVEMHKKFVHSVKKQSAFKKVILMYNHMNHEVYPILDGYCLDKFGLKSQKICPYDCLFTDDKSVLEFAHAVVFSARNLKNYKKEFDLPSIRLPHQRWILLSMESPIRPKQDRLTGVIRENDHDLRPLENTFTWTMSYRHDADIRVPFGRVLNKISKHSKMYTNDNINPESPRKTKLVAWISSDCYLERSGSSFLVAQLQQLIPVDIYGKCGQFQCPHMPQSSSEQCLELKTCYKGIAPTYKFVLALENSLCEDYVTEIFFYALEFGMVPIVYGKANYSELAVPGSFINAMNFATVLDLAVYLEDLDNDPAEYDLFFHWRRHYFVTTSFHLDIAWCSLCSTLWERDKGSLNGTTSASAHSPHGFGNQTNISSITTVGLDQLKKWSPATAFASKICDRPPGFVINTNLSFTFPGERTERSAILIGNARNEQVT